MKQALYAILLLTITSTLLHADIDRKGKVPTPARLQAVLWKYSEMSDFKLEGIMRTASALHPVIMRTKGRVMQFEFLEHPLQIRVNLIPSGSIVQRRKSSKEEWTTLSDSQRIEKILDSDIAYEDLGVDFLRWPEVTPLGTDSIKTLDAWAYEARPEKISSYDKAVYWISKDYLAVLRVDAYNKKGQVIKRVEVNGVQKVGENYVIKEMMVSNLIPGRDVSKTRTWLEIHQAKPGSELP